MYNKRHQIEFEKYATTYNSHASVQKRVAKELLQRVDFKPKSILDLGCGTGEVYRNISWDIDRFVGIDLSEAMCNLHPRNKKIEILCDDFESNESIQKISKYAPYDLLISSSSLQWAKDIKRVFQEYSLLSSKVAFSIFTDGTYRTIYDITDRESFLPSFESLVAFSKVFRDADIYKRIFRVSFDDTISMIRYIKMSGTGGGNNLLSYKEIKYLIDNYPYNYLEFEVAFILK